MNTSNIATVRKFCYNDETGEIVTYNINEETGEPLLENNIPPIFGDLRKPVDAAETTARYSNFPRGYMSKTKKFKSLKANIIAGSNQISYRLLLIPSLMIFSGLFCIVLVLLEIFLHVRCHKKNKMLKECNLYYRSPFHIITRTFCGVCRDCDTASKIGQLQDQRRDRYDYFRRIAI